MSLLLLSLIAGILTVLAPCSFMLLPIIIGGSVGKGNKYRPYIIIASLASSLFLFTILLKATSLLININPEFLKYFSGITVICLGLISFFPQIWDKISSKFNLSSSSDKLLKNAKSKDGILGAVLTGAALGPVFSTCSPTYVYILTTVLRQNISDGLINILAYILGLSGVMLGVSLLGRKFTNNLKWAVNPNGIFKKVIAVIFILVGIAIITGLDKQLQSNISPFNPVSQLEEKLLQGTKPNNNFNDNFTNKNELLNVPIGTKAAELTNIASWINSNGESIAKLKGKVVLVDFWTYSCINCLRSTPYLNSWYDNYKDQGFVVLGIHAPEFAFEKNKENVEKSVNETYKIKYPVGLDNDFSTWDAYKNQFWPAKYLIDREGNLRYTHFGEGKYDKTEEAIRLLLAENGQNLNSSTVSDKVKALTASNDNTLTPETYLGWSRSLNFANEAEKNNYNVNYNYNLVNNLKINQWSLNGNWQINKEDIVSESNNSKLILKYKAKEVYIVVGSELPTSINITSQGKQLTNQKGADVTIDASGDSRITVQTNKLYKIIKNDSVVEDQIELIVPKGVKINAFTFG